MSKRYDSRKFLKFVYTWGCIYHVFREESAILWGIIDDISRSKKIGIITVGSV